MKKLLALLLICSSAAIYAQETEYGTKFEFNTKYELDAKFVLKDNYNHYLFSSLNVEGIVTKNQLILRKFDQKNVLVDTYIHDFGVKERTTLNNFLGSFEYGNEKLIAFTESYSGKLKKKELFKHVFDKKTAKFETTLLATYTIESNNKSGTTIVRKSENGSFIGLDFIPHKEKEAPETNKVMMFDSKGDLLWQKDVSANPEFVTVELTITNTGKMVLVRNPKSWKVGNTLVMVTADGQEDKKFNEEVRLKELRSITIGEQDYLVGFNSPNKGVRSGDYDNLMFYDLTSGSILKNNRVNGFSGIKGINNVVIREIAYQNEEVVLFVEAKVDVPMNTTVGVGVPMSWDPNYTNEKPTVIVLSQDGTLKSQSDLYTNPLYNNKIFYKSFGLLNVKGNYYLNYAYLSPNLDYNRQQIAIQSFAQLDAKNSYRSSNAVYTESRVASQKSLVNQLVCYFPDSNRTVFAITSDEREMQLISVYTIKY